jgi:hypothetical protein
MATMNDEEMVSTRPRRKPDFSKRGKLKGWNEEGHYEFTEYNDRPDMVPEVIHKGKCVTVTKTQGEKESSIIVRAKVDADLPDPIGSAIGMMVGELKDKLKKEPKVTTSGLLFDTDKLKVWQNKARKKLNILIQLDLKNPQIMLVQLQELQTNIYKTINRNFLYK